MKIYPATATGGFKARAELRSELNILCFRIAEEKQPSTVDTAATSR